MSPQRSGRPIELLLVEDKPAGRGQFLDEVRALRRFWMAGVILPV